MAFIYIAWDYGMTVSKVMCHIMCVCLAQKKKGNSNHILLFSTQTSSHHTPSYVKWWYYTFNTQQQNTNTKIFQNIFFTLVAKSVYYSYLFCENYVGFTKRKEKALTYFYTNYDCDDMSRMQEKQQNNNHTKNKYTKL